MRLMSSVRSNLQGLQTPVRHRTGRREHRIWNRFTIKTLLERAGARTGALTEQIDCRPAHPASVPVTQRRRSVNTTETVSALAWQHVKLIL
jgi:hypothetical protein